MSSYIIILVFLVFGVLFYMFRNRIKNYIIKNKRNKDEAQEYVYTPVGLTRTFNISFTIEEKGDGKARIYIEKK